MYSKKERKCKNVSNYYVKTKLYRIVKNNNNKKYNPYNLKLLLQAIQTFIFRNVDIIKPNPYLDFLLDPKLKQFLIDNFDITKR